MLKPRTQDIAFKMQPGFCPEESLPDATLHIDQMGIIDEHLKHTIGVAGSNVINYWQTSNWNTRWGSDFSFHVGRTFFSLYQFKRAVGSSFKLQNISDDSSAHTAFAALVCSVVSAAFLGLGVSFGFFKLYRHVERALQKVLLERERLNNLRKHSLQSDSRSGKSRRLGQEEGARHASCPNRLKLEENSHGQSIKNETNSKKKKPRRIALYELFVSYRFFHFM